MPAPSDATGPDGAALLRSLGLVAGAAAPSDAKQIDIYEEAF